jgi:hypothetical protein
MPERKQVTYGLRKAFSDTGAFGSFKATSGRDVTRRQRAGELLRHQGLPDRIRITTVERKNAVTGKGRSRVITTPNFLAQKSALSTRASSTDSSVM